MERSIISVDKFLGLITNQDETTIPLGGVLACENLARFTPDRIQRIPGIVSVSTISNANNSTNAFPIAFRVRIDGGAEQLITVIVSSVPATRVWNVTSGVEITGGATLTDARTDLLANVWTTTYYLRRQLIANGIQAIQQIDSASTRSSLTGTPSPPVGGLIKAYLGRLYVSGVQTVADMDKVFFSDSLTTNFQAANFISTDEVPGQVLGLYNSSVSTTDDGLSGELIISKLTGIIKLAGDPLSSASSKDIVSESIGCNAINTFANTPIGTIFMGRSAGRYSIYLMRPRDLGEPTDIGQALESVLNDSSNPLLTVNLSRAVYHSSFGGQFYKLFINRNGSLIEVWLDIRELILGNGIVWYGIQRRGCRQSPVVTEDGTLNIFELIAGSGKYLKENSSLASGFTDSSGATMVAVLDFPVNVPPHGDEKIFDLFGMRFSKEVNTAGNQMSVERFIEGVSQGGSVTQSLEDTSSTSGVTVNVPIIKSGGASLAGISVRIKLQQTLSARFDILRSTIQYWLHRKPQIRGGAKTSAIGGGNLA